MAIKISGVTVISDTQDMTITGYANFSGTGAIKVPVGTDGQRPTAAAGQIRFNSTSSTFEGYNGTAWSGFGGIDETARTLATLALDSALFPTAIGTELLSAVDAAAARKTLDVVTTAGFRNAIINGNFDIWQRGSSFASPAANTYTADRWIISYDGSGATRTISIQAFTLGQTDVPNDPTWFYRLAQSVAGTAGAFNVIYQPIENVRTFAGETVTISFWAKAAASLTMPIVAFRQFFGTGGSPSAVVDTNAATSVSVGTSWTKYTYTVTLPSITGKTLGSDGNDALQFFIWLPVNTTFTFDLAQVQVENGSDDTPFERRPIGTELSLCQRYWNTSYHIISLPIAGSVYSNLYLPVTMRATPTVSTNVVAQLNVSAATEVASSTRSVQTYITVVAAGYREMLISCSSEL